MAKAFRHYRSRRMEYTAAIKALRTAGVADKLFEKIAKRLQKVEETVGAHTGAWSKIDRAKKQGKGLFLTVAEVKYLFAFKRVFDSFKKQFTRG